MTGDGVLVATAASDGERQVVLDRDDGSVLRRIPVPGHDAGRLRPVVGNGRAFAVGDGEGGESALSVVA